MASTVPIPKKLNLHDGNVAENWKKFRSAWTNYEIAAGFEAKTNKVRVAALLSVIGDDGVELYETFTWEDDEDKQKIYEVLDAFENYCTPRANILFETYRFSSRRQECNESIDSYVTALRRLAEGCNFTDKDRRIRDQVVIGLKDDRIRERLLREQDPDLRKVMTVVRATETAEQQMKIMTKEMEVSKVCKMPKSPRKIPKKDFRQHSNSQTELDCKFCGRKHERKKERCPAWGKKCNKCGNQNHFASCCTKKLEAHAVNSEPKIVKLYAIDSKSSKKKMKTVTVSATGKKLTFQIDTGASVNVLPWDEYVRVTEDKLGRKLMTSNVQLSSYGGHLWKSVGRCKFDIVVSDNVFQLEAEVVRMKASPLLSLQSSEEFGLIKIYDCDQLTKTEIKVRNAITKEQVLAEYGDVFTGLGKLDGQYKISIDESVKPVIHAPRKVPVAIRDQLKITLDKLEQDGVLAKVTKPTKWVSSLMIVMKPGKMRLCLDPKDLNKAIQREHYPLPTVEDIATRLNGAKVFSLLDAKDGFWHVELEEESSHLTTFNTPFGRYRWKRMPFGINSAPEVFQRKMHEIAENLRGLEVVADDFLVCGFGATTEEAAADHNRNLKQLLEKCRKKNLKMNKDKMRLGLSEVPFIGHLLTADGVKLDPRKHDAINNMPKPSDAKGVLRFLGMVQYLAKFLPQLSDATVNLRKLTLKNEEWNWTSDHEKEFQVLKKLITAAPVLAFYDVRKPVTIQCDASESGIGSVLMQDGRPVAFSSRSMTKTEQRYAQIEKEMLAIVHSCTKFEQYIYGRSDVKVESDHKPLERIFKKPIASSPKRLQRMLLYLQKYQLQVMYKKGTELYIADTLSRAFLKNTENQQPFEVMSLEEAKICQEIENVEFVSSIPNSKQRLEEIRRATKEDSILQKVISFVKTGWPEDRSSIPIEVRPYFTIQEELVVEADLLFKGSRNVIPTKERLNVLKNLHVSHLGIEGTLRRAREYVYWPGMNAQVKDFISKCDLCNTFRDNQRKEPLMPHEVPPRAWCTVSTDLLEFRGENFIVVTDHFSNYFEYERLKKIDAAGTIFFLKSAFGRYGIPEKLISDSGKQFDCAEFRRFAAEYGFDHDTSSPKYPQSNGKAENSVKTLKKMMKKSVEGKGDFFLMLLDFRNTPTAGIGLSPAQRMFGRRLRSLIPAKSELLEPQLYPDLKEKLENAKQQQKQNFDKGSKELEPLNVGDTVRMKLPGQDKWSKGVCVEDLGRRSYKVIVNGTLYRRNRRQLIKTPEQTRIDIDMDNDPETQQPITGGDQLEEEQPRRSTRTRRPPQRLMYSKKGRM